MEKKTFERELPKGYKVCDIVDAAHGKHAITLTLLSIVPLVVAVVLLILPFVLDPNKGISYLINENTANSFYVVAVLIIAYLVIHELVHGVVYKKHTGEKLTYGFALTCAYCGVPKIFTYRKTALAAVLAPFIFFNVLFIPAIVVSYFFSPQAYIVFGMLLAMHLSGCSGDLYVTYLFLTKYKDDRALMNDTGPRMAFFVPTDAEEFDEATVSFLEQKKAEEAKKKN